MCKIPHEIVGILEPNMHGYNIGRLGFGDLALIFKVTTELNRSNVRALVEVFRMWYFLIILTYYF